jgi:uncharacterized protein YbjT (DUF2867 family)
VAVVAATGGTGTLGRHVVDRLRPEHDVRVVSRRPGDGRVVADLTTGAGVAAAVSGADVVVHAASDTRRFGRTDEAQTRHLIQALPPSAHLVYVSIVGIDRIPYRYYRRKLACERMIETSGRPHTIVRITQFHELIAMGLAALERLPVAPVPSSFRFQSIAAAEAADVVVDAAINRPPGQAPDAGGPQVLDLGEMLRIWRDVRGRPRRTVPLPVPGRVGSGFRRGDNTVPANPAGRQTWQQFVEALPPR